MPHRPHRLTALGVALIIAPTALAAQGSSSDTALVPLTFSVPEAPAFTFLGIAPAKVSRASSARDLGAALVNGTDSTGRVLTGIALGATLWTLLPNVKIGLDTYQRRPAAYALANTQLSLGTARATGDTASTDLALGLRTTLVDRSDPMTSRAFVASLTAALRTCLDAVTGPSLGAPSGDDAAVECAGKANKRLRAEWFRMHWNAPALSWGIGTGWRLPRSELSGLDPLGASTWLSGAVPLGRSGQVLGQLQYDRRNARDDGDATNLLTYGVRAVRGTKQYNLFAEVAGTRRFETAAGVSRSNAQWSGGIELELLPDYWLSTGVGKRYTAQGEPDRMVLLANMRWGISSKARLNTLATRGQGK